MKKQKAQVIAFISGKGGVGKTTTVVGLGTALNHFGKNVTIVDANLSTPNVALHFGVPIVPVSLHDVLRGKKDIMEAVYLHKSGTKIIPGSIEIGRAHV
jgi:MinD-like ATPase involved in chromosome partitioning or flagellar assembly